VEDRLRPEGPPEERVIPEEGVARQEPDHEERAQPAQHLMREERERDPTAPRIQQPPEHADALKASGSDPSSAVEFGGDVWGRLLARGRVAVVDDRTARAELGQQRYDEIVDQGLGGDRNVEVAPNGVDRPVGPQQGPQPPLALLEEGLVSPVETLGITSGRRVG